MISPISADQMERYKHTALTHHQREQQARAQRRAQAWTLARRAVVLLQAEFGVERVAVFGSLTQPDRFTRWSDVDLAVWGLTSRNWLRAMAAARSLSDEIEINLVDVSCCSPELLRVIEHEGVVL
jgi:predicted nucleotidyltransferase